MANQRSTIREAFITLLRGINGTGSYETAPTAVYSSRPLTQNVICPCIVVPDDSETRELRGFHTVGSLLTFTVYCISDRATPDAALDEVDAMVADVERAVASSPNLGMPEAGVFLQVAEVEMIRGVEDEPVSIARLSVQTPYRFERSNP